MGNVELLEKGRLIKESLKIVEMLSKCDFDDTADLINLEDDLKKIINKAKIIKKNKYFNLH